MWHRIRNNISMTILQTWGGNGHTKAQTFPSPLEKRKHCLAGLSCFVVNNPKTDGQKLNTKSAAMETTITAVHSRALPIR